MNQHDNQAIAFFSLVFATFAEDTNRMNEYIQAYISFYRFQSVLEAMKEFEIKNKHKDRFGSLIEYENGIIYKEIIDPNKPGMDFSIEWENFGIYVDWKESY